LENIFKPKEEDWDVGFLQESQPVIMPDLVGFDFCFQILPPKFDEFIPKEISLDCVCMSHTHKHVKE